MATQARLVRNASKGQCPHCRGDIFVGTSTTVSSVDYIVTRAVMDEGKNRVAEAIAASAATEEEKAQMLAFWADPERVVTPTEARELIDGLEAAYGTRTGDLTSDPKKAKKPK